MIQINQLSFGYKKRNLLFDNLDLDLEGGNIYGLLGKNGAGKTTLLRLISGLCFSDQGEIDVLGFRPQLRQPGFLQDIYFITEDIYVPPVSIHQFERMNAPFYPRYSPSQFRAYLQAFDVDPSAKMKGISFGQKKKVLLSFGMATNCKILILDEPTNGLDIPSKGQFRKILAGSITDERLFIVSTHQVRDMTNMIDPIIVLDQGKIIFNQSIEAVNRNLLFLHRVSAQASDNAIYSERVPGGYLEITPNPQGIDNDIDLEVLFNAIGNEPHKIIQSFQKITQHEY